MLNSVLALSGTGEISPLTFLLLTLAALAMGLASAWLYQRGSECSKGFFVTLAALPAMIELIIMLVNGNIGTGVAVMGAFSLVRFRSMPGTAREIGAIFLAMALGLAIGTGYVLAALVFLLLMGAFTFILEKSRLGERNDEEKELRVTIPENLDYAGLFDDLFSAYARGVRLTRVKTSNMGSLYELQYHLRLRERANEKEFIDQLRCRNGNLNISLGRVPTNANEL